MAFVFGTQLSFLPSFMGHAMNEMAHSVSSSIVCSPVCNSATLNKNDYLSEHHENKDDEPDVPFYAQLQGDVLVALEKQHSQNARSVVGRDAPPGGPPAYIALSVFRI